MSWRDTILSKFVREAGRLTLVADPDGLLTEEGVLAGLQARGFSLLTFDDPVAFRLAYESQFRSHWDLGLDTELVVALRTATADTAHLPFDLVSTGRALAFSLEELFPTLSPGVLGTLDRALLGAVETALEVSGSHEERGPIATAEFLLIYLFHWSPGQTTPEQVLAWLLTHHYQGRTLPAGLAEHAAKVWRRQPKLNGLPLAEWLQDQGRFLHFLQNEWRRFVFEQLPNPNRVHEPTETYEPQPLRVAFESETLRLVLDNCFAEGLLQPVQLAQSELALPPERAWMQCGLSSLSPAQRADRSLARAAQLLPEAEAPHQEWQAYARVWAGARAAVALLPAGERGAAQANLDHLRATADQRFQAWALERFGLLSSLPSSPPVLGHHIVHWMQRRRDEGLERQALLVLDGLAWDQWLRIRDHLARSRPTWSWSDHSTYSWVPTITKISRLALFTGLPPFLGGIEGSQDREAKGWSKFWREAGIPATGIGYHNVSLLPDRAHEELGTLSGELDRFQILGVVVRALDELMHGENLGEAGLLRHVQEWLESGALEQLLERILTQGFSIVITSDHGCLEATGIGKPNQGVLVDERGQRACLYSTEAFRQEGLTQIPSAIAWPGPGLPPGNHYLLASERSAFLATGLKQVVHGGLTLDEVVVPCISLSAQVVEAGP